MAKSILNRYLCIHCERVNVIRPVAEVERIFEGSHLGADSKCAFCGAGHLDLFPWRSVCEKNGYPRFPDHGAAFALYPASPSPEVTA
jgi:hypothetical protein